MGSPDLFHYGPVTEADFPALSRIIHFAFSGTTEYATKWLHFAGVNELRMVCDTADAEARASLVRVPMGQWFGGRSVPMLGVAGVGTAPEARGRGIARRMMEAFVREAAAEGWALAGLYASTQALYRQSGFEQGGFCFEIRIPVKELAGIARPPGDELLALRQIAEWPKPEHRWIVPEAVREVYRGFAKGYDGMLDRGAYTWSRVQHLREDHFDGFGVYAPASGSGGAETLEGYVYFTQVRGPASGKHDIQLSDFAYSTPRAARRLARLLADMATMGEHVIIRQAGPIHPLLTLLPLQAYRVDRREYWMTRITHLPKAVEARGWPAGLRASLGLDVTDALVDANAGSWTLSVADGRGTLERRAAGGAAGPAAAVRAPTIRCDIRGLVPLYTGLYSARQAAGIGLIEGDEAAVAAANALFPGGSPWMSDFF